MSKKELRLHYVDFNFIGDMAKGLVTLCLELRKLNEIMGGDDCVKKAIRTIKLLEYDLVEALENCRDFAIGIEDDMRGDDE